MGEAKPSQHAGFVEICVAVCRPEFMARSSQLYYFMVSPGLWQPDRAQVTDGVTMVLGPAGPLRSNHKQLMGVCRAV